MPLREPAPKRGRPAERPMDDETECAPTAWKEAGVGRVATYLTPLDPEAEEPQRVDVRYAARMPEAADGWYRRWRHKLRHEPGAVQGLILSSGPVEAAAKTLIGHRLKRSGMRWTREGGQQILNLRVHVQSKRWGAFLELVA